MLFQKLIHGSKSILLGKPEKLMKNFGSKKFKQAKLYPILYQWNFNDFCVSKYGDFDDYDYLNDVEMINKNN